MSVSSKMKFLKIEPNQGKRFKTQWVNATLCTVLFIGIFLICSVILSLRLLEREKLGTTANVDAKEPCWEQWHKYEPKLESVELCLLFSYCLCVLQENHFSLGCIYNHLHEVAFCTSFIQVVFLSSCMVGAAYTAVFDFMAFLANIKLTSSWLQWQGPVQAIKDFNLLSFWQDSPKFILAGRCMCLQMWDLWSM